MVFPPFRRRFQRHFRQSNPPSNTIAITVAVVAHSLLSTLRPTPCSDVEGRHLHTPAPTSTDGRTCVASELDKAEMDESAALDVQFMAGVEQRW
jgi:hypothetical protein